MRFSLFMKMAWYGATSSLAVGSDIGLLWLLMSSFSVPYLIAAAIGFSVGCVVKYLVSKYLVFENNQSNSEVHTVSLFILIAIIGLSTNHLIIYTGVEYFNLHVLLAKIVSAGLVFVMNFFLIGLLVFKDSDIVKAVQAKDH